MRLVIAEKPSVAMSIAKVLGAVDRKDGFMEGKGLLVSWCIGHLAGLAEPAVYNPAYDKWRKEDLPILPESWRFTIAPDKWDQFDVLRPSFAGRTFPRLSTPVTPDGRVS